MLIHTVGYCHSPCSEHTASYPISSFRPRVPGQRSDSSLRLSTMNLPSSSGCSSRPPLGITLASEIGHFRRRLGARLASLSAENAGIPVPRCLKWNRQRREPVRLIPLPSAAPVPVAERLRNSARHTVPGLRHGFDSVPAGRWRAAFRRPFRTHPLCASRIPGRGPGLISFSPPGCPPERFQPLRVATNLFSRPDMKWPRQPE